MFHIFTILLISLDLFGEAEFEYDKDFFNQEIENEYFIDDPTLEKKTVVVQVENISAKEVEEKFQNGVKKDFYSDGKLKYEISYRNGQKDGMEKLFYSDGKLKSEIAFRDGRKDGMEKLFYSDGKLKSETNYRDNRKDGFEKIFYSDGRISSEIEYRDGREIRVIFRGR